jgi:hypothetical protein
MNRCRFTVRVNNSEFWKYDPYLTWMQTFIRKDQNSWQEQIIQIVFSPINLKLLKMGKIHFCLLILLCASRNTDTAPLTVYFSMLYLNVPYLSYTNSETFVYLVFSKINILWRKWIRQESGENWYIKGQQVDLCIYRQGSLLCEGGFDPLMVSLAGLNCPPPPPPCGEG